MIVKRDTQYLGHDFWTKERHRFVRRLQRPEAIEGPYQAPTAMNMGDVAVVIICGAVALIAMLKWVLPWLIGVFS